MTAAPDASRPRARRAADPAPPHHQAAAPDQVEDHRVGRGQPGPGVGQGREALGGPDRSRPARGAGLGLIVWRSGPRGPICLPGMYIT